MKANLTKLISLVLVFLMSSLTFVTAADVCCEKLADSEEYCVYTDEESCDSEYKDAAVSCEQTSFCKVGCCYSSDDGECYKNVPRSECSSMEGTTWTESQMCDISQCKKGCCVLGSQGFYVTEVRCKLETSKYGNVTMEWKPEILSEPECQATAKSQDMGCCVSGDACAFTTRELCPSAGTAPTAETETIKEGFYKDMLCSNDLLTCGCAKQTNTGCYDDKVYWFDSCGNRENVYSSDKDKSYNNGYALKPNDICESPAILDPDCGNCDYAQGSICRASTERGMEPTEGSFICSKTSCDETYDDGISPNAGSAKKNGESWCLYDGAVGNSQDLVGSRHYRELCINGEEMTEPCMDYREELCIQGVLGEPPTGTLKAFEATGDYIEAACRDNRWEDCLDCGAGQGCCENEAFRDCNFMSILKVGLDPEVAAGNGLCVPEVPPGLQFWPSETTELPTSTTRSTPATIAAIADTTTAAVTTGGGKHGAGRGPNSNAESVCSQANQECTVVWNIGGTGRLGIGGIMTQSEWECVQNCHCTEPSWVIGGNNFCKTLGDCGAYYNILGKATLDGYANSASGQREKDKGLYFDGYTLTEKDLGDWKTLAIAGEPIEDEDGDIMGVSMDDLISHLGVPIIAMALTGLFYPGAAGGIGGFISGGTSGINLLISGFTKETWAGLAAKQYGSLVIKENTKYALEKGGQEFISKGGKWYEVGTEKVGDKIIDVPGKEVGEKTAEKLNEKALEKGTAEYSGGTGMGVLQTIMWLYTIYQIIDILYADTKERTYSVACSPWVAPEGGSDCEICNEDEYKPCSIYRCKSLGQNCFLVNEGTSEEKCIDVNPNDVNSPIIEPWEEVIPKDYTITPTTFEGNKGYKINEKIGPYDAITLGITTDEPAQCKFIDKVGIDFDEMATFFGDSQYLYEHQINFVIPAELTTKEALRKTGDTYNLYIRCKDTIGNKNERDYFIRFTLEPEPDMTAPVIGLTSIEQGAYIPSNVEQTSFSVYLEERAECNYDVKDTEYSLMENSFECSTSPFTTNSVLYGLYECKTTLDFANITDYKWYIRCKDTAENENKESFVFSLKPTEPLEIVSIGPEGTFYEEEVTLKVVTAEGAENGKATCAYSQEDEPFSNMIVFLNTDATLHEQPLTPGVGEFTYYVKCLDVAGNIAEDSTTFTLDVDLQPPKILFIYVTPSNYLHMEMDEASTCEYSNSTFMFGDGKEMTGSGTTIHELSIIEKMYRITCQDIYFNEASFIVYP